MDRVRALLRQAGVLYADETQPARPVNCTMCISPAPSSSPPCTPGAGPLKTSTTAASSPVTPGRSCGTATPAMRTCPTRCTPGAARTGCATSPGCTASTRTVRLRARSMADLLIWANRQATAARAAGQASLSGGQLAQIRSWYRGAVAKGITDNQHRRSQIVNDGLRLARRFRDHQDMILRFATDLTVGFTSNEAERGVRPVKVQQRTSGGCWRTLQGLADFAVVQSCMSTAAKWGINALDALTQLFAEGPWLPAAIRPG